MRGQGYKQAAALLPGGIRASALSLPEGVADRAEEFRLRAGAVPSVLLPDGERALLRRAVTPHELATVLETATRASAHTALESVRSGYITVRGGVRLGLAGQVSESAGHVLTIRQLSSVAVRIPREVSGCAREVYPGLTAGGFESTLIISPPGGGKTTLLRELIRLLAEGRRVSLVDERGEVAGVYDGVPEFDVGARCDVMTGVDKRTGAGMLLRAMNPEILAMDEITEPADLDAVRSAAGCGVALLATAHARDLEDMSRRSLYRELLALGVFRRVVELENRAGVRRCRLRELP